MQTLFYTDMFTVSNHRVCILIRSFTPYVLLSCAIAKCLYVKKDCPNLPRFTREDVSHTHVKCKTALSMCLCFKILQRFLCCIRIKNFNPERVYDVMWSDGSDVFWWFESRNNTRFVHLTCVSCSDDQDRNTERSKMTWTRVKSSCRRDDVTMLLNA